MEYRVEYQYDEINYGGYSVKALKFIYLHFEKILVRISFDRKYRYLYIHIVKEKNVKDKRKKIDVSVGLIGLIDFLKSNQFYFKRKDKPFKEDILKIEKVRQIGFGNLKLCAKDIAILSEFKNLQWLETYKCTIYENCNLGSLKCSYRDKSSLICNLNSFNGFAGEFFHLIESRIKNQKGVLHLDSVVATFEEVKKINYELFFLTTDAPNLKKIEIKRNPRLKDKELLFIFGFYNLESILIEGNVTSYVQIEKLEKLRRIERLFCTDMQELEIVKKRKEYYKEINNLEQRRTYLILQRMFIQNEYQEFFHKLYVPRLERVLWQDKISSYDLEQIKCELQKIASMPRSERKLIAREPIKKEYTVCEIASNLCFDKKMMRKKNVIS